MQTKLFQTLAAVIFCTTASTQVFADTTTITGAGATFPYPVYAQWAQAYKKATGIQLNYQAIGSGGGIKQIEAKTVDFGASDKPLSSTELNQNHLMQFPTVVGGIVPVINMPGIPTEKLHLSGQVLADIYLGQITKWNDKRIASLNPTLNLPDENITVVHRSDGSGTTFLFTHYLSGVSDAWKKQVGSDTAVAWPAGIGGKGNEGVSAYVQRVKGAIGYVEYAYAKQNKLPTTLLENASGKYVSPSVDNFEAAAKNAHWTADTNFAEILTNEPGDKSWPITGATFILMPVTVDKPATAKEVLKFFDWSYQNGRELALNLDYVPLPKNVIKDIQIAWKTQIKDKKGDAIWG